MLGAAVRFGTKHTVTNDYYRPMVTGELKKECIIKSHLIDFLEVVFRESKFKHD